MRLTDSGCTMSRSPFGRTATTGFTAEVGTLSRFTALSAQAGSGTRAAFGGVNDSLPPNALAVTGLPDGFGVRMAVTARPTSM